MSGQRTLRIEMTEFQPSQYERLAQVYGRIFPEYDRSPSEWRFGDESLDRSKYHFQRYTCFGGGGGGVFGLGKEGPPPWDVSPEKVVAGHLGRPRIFWGETSKWR